MKGDYARYDLAFRFEAKTSREILRVKPTWFVRLRDENTGKEGVGEAPYFESLAPESFSEFLKELQQACRCGKKSEYSSAVRFGMESALLAMKPQPVNKFTSGEAGIPINGLIWMGEKSEMRRRIDEKLESGFKVIKIKIGGIRFEEELDLLRYIRKGYSPEVLELRLDANGSFSPDTAMEKLLRLSEFFIHSIEQPIASGQWQEMGKLCRKSPIPIALDEELIGVTTPARKEEMLRSIHPQYIIIKPSLCGGLVDASGWAETAENLGIGWWATSALESNIGLCAIANWVWNRGVTIPQGLGTGQLYWNNIPSPLELKGDHLFFNPDKPISIPELKWQQ